MDTLDNHSGVDAQGHPSPTAEPGQTLLHSVSSEDGSDPDSRPSPLAPSETPPPAAYDFSGLLTALVIGYVKERAPDALAGILAAADETRSLADLEDAASSSTYRQARRLLEATAAALGGLGVLRNIAEAALEQWGLAPEAGSSTLSLGSPAAVLRSPDMATAIFPIVEYQTEEIGPDEWRIGLRLFEGYEPFPELCTFVIGIFCLVPRLFGFAQTEIVEETCQCTGATWCRFRLSWVDKVDAEVRAAEDRKSFEGGLSSLQRTMTELVSGEGLQSVLPKIIRAAARTVMAPVHILSIELGPTENTDLFWRGTDESTARHYVASLDEEGGSQRAHVVVREVTSARSRYGRLIAFRHPGQAFNQGEQAILETYASLAAAALDSAMALDEARREAAVSRTLFELSASLVEPGTVEEVAQRLADAVPSVVGCDRAIVILRQGSAAALATVALSGYTPAEAARVRETIGDSPHLERRMAERSLLWQDHHDDTSSFATTSLAIGSALSVSFPMYAGDQLIGAITADVADRPWRLRNLPDLAERLQGLAGYAIVGLRNAQLHQELRHQSQHDSLTGLPNRTLILDRIDRMLVRDRRYNSGVGLLFVDLDLFKQVNDSYGHQVGDELLKAVAARFVEAVRETDTVGRLGGDEFVVLSEGLSMAEGPELVAERLLEALNEPFRLWIGERLHTMQISASIGVAVGQRLDSSELLRDGDIALYEAKAAGRSRFVVFQREMQIAVRDHHALETELRHAVEADQFFVLYQPIVELETMDVVGVEALLRWRHPHRGVVEPTEFIPTLEESGLIGEVGRFVLVEACQQARVWRDAGHPISISVNVSGRTLQDERLVDDVRGTLRSSRLEPGALIVEITETSVMADTDKALAQFDKLRALGVRLAIDDFGTGYSSLSYLSRFAVDSIKIDRSFVAEMTTSAAAEALVDTLVHLGQLLRLRTVAEGIEDVDQLSMLKLQGCDYGQGFLFAPPLPPDEVAAYFPGATHLAAGNSWKNLRVADRSG